MILSEATADSNGEGPLMCGGGELFIVYCVAKCAPWVRTSCFFSDVLANFRKCVREQPMAGSGFHHWSCTCSLCCVRAIVRPRQRSP